jgi:CRISPR-associated protein Csm5
MTRFIHTHALALTPLTPIHIGCGEDFEPTNYVIKDGVLYHFDPARLALSPSERNSLSEAANLQGDRAIRAVQSFFHKKRDACAKASTFSLPVASGVSTWYENRVGSVVQRERDGRTVSNQLGIERTAHHPHSGRPYIPGSSLKGSMRTAWLNHIDRQAASVRDLEVSDGKGSSEIEAQLLGYAVSAEQKTKIELHRDPFRLVKVADAVGEQVAGRVVFAVDRYKEEQPRRNGQGKKNPYVPREVIAGGQYRALRGEIRFDVLAPSLDQSKVPAPGKRIPGFAQLALACNRFYGARLREDLALLRRRRFVDDEWIAGIEALLESLRPQLDAGRAMLLRVGRHSGAESVTLEKRRAIGIMGGKKRATSVARAATTVWLAAEREDSRTGLLPLGFILVEQADAPENAPLAHWCEKQATRVDGAVLAHAPAAAATRQAAPSAGAETTVWEKARLRFNHNNKTLTAVGPNGVQANALKPKGEELLSKLPPDVQQKVRRNEFVQVKATVRGAELTDIEAKG